MVLVGRARKALTQFCSASLFATLEISPQIREISRDFGGCTMPRLIQELKTKMIVKLRSGVSINKIAASTGLGKSTIYYYYKKIKGKKYREPQFTSMASEIEGEIVGIFAGDGSQYYDRSSWHYEVNIHFGGHNFSYAKYVQRLFESFFHKKFRLHHESRGTIRVRTDSKTIFNYFSNYLSYDPQVKHVTVRLKTTNLPMQFKVGFLRGLFDTDGCIIRSYSNEKHGQSVRHISFHTTSVCLHNDVGEILTQLGISFSQWVQKDKRGYKDMYRTRIRKDSVNSFIKHVNPFKVRRWTGG